MLIGTKEWFAHVADQLGTSFVGIRIYKGKSSTRRTPRPDEKHNRFYIGILAVVIPHEVLEDQLGYEVAHIEDPELGIYELRFPPKTVIPLLKNLIPTAEIKGLKVEDNELSDDHFCLRREPQHPVFIFEPE